MSELQHIAELLEEVRDRLAALEGALGGAIASPRNEIDKDAAAQLLGIRPGTLADYRKQWIEGVHYFRQAKGYFYNHELLKDWLKNRFEPRQHQRAIDDWVKRNQIKKK